MLKSRLDKTIRASRICKLIPTNKQEFQVSEGARKFIVDLSKKSYIYDKWEIARLPCKYAILYVGYTRENLKELCDDCYKVAKYLKAYSSVIHLLLDSNLDPRNDDENMSFYWSKDCLEGQEKIGEIKKMNLFRGRGRSLWGVIIIKNLIIIKGFVSMLLWWKRYKL